MFLKYFDALDQGKESERLLKGLTECAPDGLFAKLTSKALMAGQMEIHKVGAEGAELGSSHAADAEADRFRETGQYSSPGSG